MKNDILKKRVQHELYSIYENYLENDRLERFNQVKENDPYLNQVIEDVFNYVIYDLPLDSYIIKRLKG